MSYFRKRGGMSGLGADLPSACSPSSPSYDPDVCVEIYKPSVPADSVSPPLTSFFNDIISQGQSAVASVTGGGSASSSGGLPPIVIVAGLALGAWFLFGKKGR